MTNPKKEIREYLSNLIKQLLYINGLDEQLKIIKDWESENKFEALNIGGYFFRLVAYSFNRTILIELCKLFSDKKKQKSIVDFLKKAREHTSSIEASKFNPASQKREILKPEVYHSYIDEQEKLITSKNKIIINLKTHRDKALAHSDSAYFSDPEKLYKNFPLDTEEIDELMKVATEILRYQHVYLLESDLEIKVYSVRSIDAVLQYVRAYKRILDDKEINGAEFLRYKWDDYKKDKK